MVTKIVLKNHKYKLNQHTTNYFQKAETVELDLDLYGNANFQKNKKEIGTDT